MVSFKVYVNLEEREWWLPSQPLDLEVVAEPSSLVCLLGGRSGGNNDIRFDPRIRWASLESFHYSKWSQGRDGGELIVFGNRN